jgi:WD40 repeat protein
MAGVFLSYARSDDEPFVERLRDELTAAGIDVWWDRQAMQSRGRTFLQEIADAVIAADRVVLVVGPAARKSRYVTAEWTMALEHCRPVVPVLRLGTRDDIPAPLAHNHAVDLRGRAHRAKGLAELVRILRTPPAAPGPLIGVPSPPADLVAREDLVARVGELLLADTLAPVVITGAGRTAAVVGMGGVGKSVLATLFATRCATRWAFANGVVWLHAGQDFDPLSVLQAIDAAMGGDAALRHPDVRSARAAAAARLAERRALLVLDDVWRQDDLDLLGTVLGPRCRLLATTRDLALARSSGGGAVELDVLGDDDAMALLALTSRADPTTLPASAALVAQECGNLPLALTMCGRMVSDGYLWDDVLEALREADLAYVRRAIPDYPYPDLLRAIDVSVAWLRQDEPDAARCYEALAAFQPGSGVPESVVVRLWTSLLGRERDARAALVLLQSRALLSLDAGTVQLHDLQWDYLVSRSTDAAALHAALLDAYAPDCPDGWPSGPDDGYFHGHLVQHLTGAGREDEARSLLRDFSWLTAALRAVGPARVVADFDGFADDASLASIQDAVRGAAHVLASDPDQLAAQLLGSLLDVPDGRLDGLRESAASWAGATWLRPMRGMLPPPGQPRIRTLRGHAYEVRGVAFDLDERFAISASRDRTVGVWDLRDGTRLKVLSGHDEIVHRVAPIGGGRFVSVSNDGTARVWDRDTGSCTAVFDHHRRAAASSRYAGDSSVTAVFAVGDGLVATAARSIVLWRPGDLKVLATWEHGEQLLGVTPDTRFLLCGGASSLELRAVPPAGEDATKPEDRSFPLPERPEAAAVTPDGATLVVLTGTNQGSTIHRFELDSGRSCGTIALEPINASELALVLDGSAALVGSSSRPQLVDLEGGSTTDLDQNVWVEAVAATRDGRHALTGHMDGTIGYWDLTRTRGATAGEPVARVSHVVLAPAPPVRVFAVRRHQDRGAETLTSWDPSTLEVDADVTLPVGAEVTAVGCADDGGSVAAGCADGTIRVFDRRLRERLVVGPLDAKISALTCQVDGSRAAAAVGRSAVVVDLRVGEVIASHAGHTENVLAVALSADGTRLLTGSDDTTVGLWDVATGTLLQQLFGHPRWVDTVRFLHRSDRALSTSGKLTPTTALWDLSTGRYLWAVRGSSPVAVSNDEALLAACFHDINRPDPVYTFSVWDLSTGTLRWTSPPLGGEVADLDFTPDGRAVLSADENGSLHLWSASSGTRIAGFDGRRAFERCLAVGDDIVVASTALGLHGWRVVERAAGPAWSR